VGITNDAYRRKKINSGKRSYSQNYLKPPFSSSVPHGLFNNKESCKEITMLDPSHPTRIMNLWGTMGITVRSL